MNVPASTVPENPASIVRLASIPHGVSLLFQGPAPSANPVPGPPNIPPIYPIPELPTFIPQPPPFTPPTLLPPARSALASSPPTSRHRTDRRPEQSVPEVDIASDVAGSQSNGPYPPDFQDFINDPNSVLRNAIAGQNILGTITIQLSTENVTNSIGNIPFLGTPNPAQAQKPITSQRVRLFGQGNFLDRVGAHRQPAPGKPTANAPGNGHGHGPFPGQPTFLQLQYSQLSILIFNGVVWPHVNVATLTLSHG